MREAEEATLDRVHSFIHSGTVDLERSRLSVPYLGDHFVLSRITALESDLSRAQARALVWRTWDDQMSGPPLVPHRCTGQDPTKRTSQCSWCKLAAGDSGRLCDAKPAAYWTPFQIFCWGLLPYFTVYRHGF